MTLHFSLFNLNNPPTISPTHSEDTLTPKETQKACTPTLTIISAQAHQSGGRDEAQRGEEWCVKGGLPQWAQTELTLAAGRPPRAHKCSSQQVLGESMKDARVCAGDTRNDISRRMGSSRRDFTQWTGDGALRVLLSKGSSQVEEFLNETQGEFEGELGNRNVLKAKCYSL